MEWEFGGWGAVAKSLSTNFHCYVFPASKNEGQIIPGMTDHSLS